MAVPTRPQPTTVPPGGTLSPPEGAPGGAPPVDALPDGDEARRLLARLRVPAVAVDEILAGRPRPGTAGWARMEERRHELATSVRTVCWPPVPDDAPVVERWSALWAFLAAVPHVLALDAARGVPEEITWHTLGDIGDSIGSEISLRGRPAFEAFWFSYHMRGRIYRLGRLQFNIGAATVDSGPDAPFSVGDPVLGVHIPMAGPLTRDVCDDAFARGRAFFQRYVSDRHVPVGTCRSWLLDEQLAEFLPESSNIVQFQRRFHVLDGWSLPGDASVLHFVFGQQNADPAELEPTSTLERAIVDRLLGGGHFLVRRGWLRL